LHPSRWIQKELITVNVSPNIGINAIPFADDIEIIPNPLEDISFINIPENYKNGDIVIYDITGKQIKKFSLSGQEQIKLKRKDFAAGVYTVVITSSSRVKAKLLVR